jgi:DNA-binding NarL/FixJ family response regulator
MGRGKYDQLPVTHQEVLRCVDRGMSDAEIAARLDVEPQAVPVLIEVARAKLARLDAHDESNGSSTAGDALG